MVIRSSLLIFSVFASLIPTATVAALPASAKVTATHETTDYSKAFGKRREWTLESAVDLGRTTVLISGSHGRRNSADQSWSGLQLSGAIWHDWSGRLTTRTTFAVASNSPVFARREIGQDVSYKLLENGVVTIGAKQARYYRGTDVATISAGGTWHFRGGFASYRYSAHNVDELGNTASHLATVRVRDRKGNGSTQLWLSGGTSLHEGDIHAAGIRGTFRGLHLQRLQPIGGPVAVSVGLGRTWYDTDTSRYRGTRATIGLNLSGTPRL